MPPKSKIAAPIDRPLSRAYLREFTGWSTAYPPGLSDPTSLRVMENMMVNRDGSIRVRPGLKYLSFDTMPSDGAPGTGIQLPVVGTHEPFYLNDGSKAYLFAVRELDGTVGFRVLAVEAGQPLVRNLTDSGVDFDLPPGSTGLNFTSATTYVKYLQIDNKVFALSNAGEPMRLFHVGEVKRVPQLESIERPAWTIDDKLTVVQPPESWISSGVIATRTNLVRNPSAELTSLLWYSSEMGDVSRVKVPSFRGSYSFVLKSKPTAENLMPRPLHDVNSTGTAGWSPGYAMASVSVNAANNTLEGTTNNAFLGKAYVNGPPVEAKAGVQYRIGFNAKVLMWNDAEQICLVRFHSASGSTISQTIKKIPAAGGWQTFTVTAPSGTTSMRVYPGVDTESWPVPLPPGITARPIVTTQTVELSNLLVCKASEGSTFFHGGSGADYFWTGAVNASPSVYHPPQAVDATIAVPAVPGQDYASSVYVAAMGTTRNVTLSHHWWGAGGWVGAPVSSTPLAESGSFQRTSLLDTAPAGANALWLKINYDAPLPRGESHKFDAVMIEQSSSLGTYFDGSSPEEPTFKHRWEIKTYPGIGRSYQDEYGSPPTIPTPPTPTTDTLISSTAADNTYNFAFFYTLYNEVGESAPSRVSTIRTQRGWNAWRWETPNASSEPSGTATEFPAKAADQLVAYMPQEVFDAGISRGALGWHLYVTTWSDQATMPVTAVKIATKVFKDGSSYGDSGWLRVTPEQAPAGADDSAIPYEDTRYNYSNPSSAGQGVVAGDRMVLVYDPAAAAVVKWSSNVQGSYTDFSANLGGGFKTLTTGNLYVPAAVKLWQNPESKDTLIVLCLGVDGHSSSFYMMPASVSSQSDNVIIMGFEETTATPGTTSPYGVEVFNNALYRPTESELMKSTASNYNISHKPETDEIANLWIALTNKDKIISSQMDRRIYYLVHNPYGEELEPDCWGNEVWVLDLGVESGTWSRWLTQGHSLRKIEVGGRTVMSLVRPDGIYYFDDQLSVDEYVDDTTQEVLTRNIDWKLITNTQGANRAHDAWAHLQQVSVALGNFNGKMRWGVRGKDLHGKTVDIAKVTQDLEPRFDMPFDISDHLLVRRDMMEWEFFAESIESEHSEGQVSLVQYRYTPVSVNVGYEYGSVETFEYSRNVAVGNNALYTDGTTTPMMDRSRP